MNTSAEQLRNMYAAIDKEDFNKLARQLTEGSDFAQSTAVVENEDEESDDLVWGSRSSGREGKKPDLSVLLKEECRREAQDALVFAYFVAVA